MYLNFRAPTGTLESIRRTRGLGACQRYFQKVLEERPPGDAAELLNSPGLRFPTLFALKPQIEKAGIQNSLGGKRKAALQICGKVLKDQKSPPEGGISYSDKAVRAAFLWMFQTGTGNDGLSNEYDEILDLSACVLARRYRETAILPALSALIFHRNRKRGYLHDLIWAFFQFHDPGALRYLAPYLRSGSARDRELARLLLHLPDPGENRRGWEAQYQDFLNWLRENKAYLYFTGESLQSSNQPKICSLDREAKYLGKQISPRKRKPVSPLTKEEEESLSCFAQAEENEKSLLSNYSGKLRRRNPASWNRWIHSPVKEQIRLAKTGSGRRFL